MSKLFFYAPVFQSLLASGEVNNGGLVYFFEPGTSTPKDTYTDASLTVANANPVVLSSAGKATIVLSGAYKVRVEDADGNVLDTTDNFPPAETATAGAFNLVTNGSFEDNGIADGKTPDGWTLTEETGSTVVLDDTDPQRGSQSIKFTSAGSGGGNIVTTSFFEVTPLRGVEVSFLLKSSAADVRNLVQIEWYTAAQASISSESIYDDSTANPTSWTLKRNIVTPPSTARFAKLRLYGCHPSDATTGSTWFDDVLVRVIAPGAANGRVAGIAGGGEAWVVPGVRGHISGLLPSNNGTDAEHDIDISAGACRNSDDDATIALTTGITKRLDATFAEGTGNGGMADGESLPTSSTVHLFIVTKDTDGTVDVMADTSVTGANADAGWTVERRIASLRTDSSANILAGTAVETGGGAYMWQYATPIAEWATSLNAGARSLKTLTGVPAGIKVMWHGNVRLFVAAGTVGAIVTSPDQSDVAVTGSAAGAGLTLATENNNAVDGQDVSRVTNTSAQVGIRSSGTGSDWGTTYGFTDWRTA